MEIEKVITGSILFVFGGLSIFATGLILNFRIWIAKRMYGATYKPTQKTYQIQKVLGVLFILLGLLVLTGIL